MFSAGEGAVRMTVMSTVVVAINAVVVVVQRRRWRSGGDGDSSVSAGRRGSCNVGDGGAVSTVAIVA